MIPVKTAVTVAVPHRYQVEERRARFLAEARRERIRASRLVGNFSTRLRAHRFLRTPQEF